MRPPKKGDLVVFTHKSGSEYWEGYNHIEIGKTYDVFSTHNAHFYTDKDDIRNYTISLEGNPYGYLINNFTYHEDYYLKIRNEKIDDLLEKSTTD